MFGLVINIVDVIVRCTRNLFRLFCLFGRILAIVFCWLGQALVLFYEEIVNFSEQIYETSKTCVHILQYISGGVTEILGYVLEKTAELVTTGQISMGKLPSVLTEMSTKCRICLYESLRLVGNSVWMLIMFLPNLVLFLVRFIYLLMCSTFSSIVEILMDLPPSALVGCAILGVAIAMHKSTLPLARRGLTKVFQCVLLPILLILRNEMSRILRETGRSVRENSIKIHGAWTKVITFSLRQQTTKTLSSPTTSSHSPDRQRQVANYCAICHELERSVVLFPCRHLCLCASCSAELRRYDNKCPLCRQLIAKTVTVYS